MGTNNLKLLPVLALLSGLFAACSNEIGVENPQTPDLPEIIPDEPTQIDIQETPLPIIENFGAADAATFFGPTYRSLTTPASNQIEDDSGNSVTLTDPWPSFYYPTCCFFRTDSGTGELIRTPPFEDDLDYTFRIADNKLQMSSARFSIGQILSDLTPDIPERKSDTTDSPQGASLELGSWGELDLTQPYRVSFCLVDFGQQGTGNSNLELWVDNNSGGRSNESIHGVSSLLLRAALVSGSVLVSGNRVVADVPGDVYMIDNAGTRVGPTLGVIQPIAEPNLPVGTFSSFLQLRVSSGGYIVISDLVIERQAQNNAAGMTCTADPTFYIPPPPPVEEGTPFAGLPLDVDATVAELEFFAQTGNTGDFLSISNNLTDGFYKEVGSPARIFVESADNAIRYGNALWTMGLKSGGQDDCTSYPCPTGTPNGDIDLTQDYRIRADILDLPLATGQFQIQIDNSTGTGANSVHGSASRILQLLGSELSLGTLEINVPGAVTINGSPVMSSGNPVNIATRTGTSTSFIAFRCPSNCGNAAESGGVFSGGIKLGNIQVSYQSASSSSSGGAPPAPNAPSLTAGDAQIEVNWLAVGGATGYDVAYNTVDDSVGATAFSGNPVAGTSATITGLANGTQYFVFVRAKNASGDSAYSASSFATPSGVVVPAVPATPTATGKIERVDVSWAAVASATAYDVAYNTIDDPDTADGATVVADQTGASTTITGLAGATQYFVFVRAKNSAGNSAYSPSASAVTLAAPAVTENRTWDNTADGEFAEIIYASILATPPPAGTNNNVVAGTDTVVNGLHFFASSAGPLRHRSTANEFNYNGSSYTSDVTTPAVGMAAPATRAYIGVPVDSATAVTIGVNHRNSSSSANAAVRIVFIGGTSGNVLCVADSSSNTATDTNCVLAAAHGESEVRIIYSREGTGSGGMHLGSISRTY